MSTTMTTYRELADRWGVNTEAAKARVRRAGWHRVPGNDGAVRVVVPLEALEATTPAPATHPPTASPHDPLEEPAVVALVAELRAQIAAAKSETAELHARLQEALAGNQNAERHAEALEKLAALQRQARRGRWRR